MNDAEIEVEVGSCTNGFMGAVGITAMLPCSLTFSSVIQIPRKDPIMINY